MADDAPPSRGTLIALETGALRWRCSCGHIGLTMTKAMTGARGLEIVCEFCCDRAFWLPPQ